MNIASRLIAAGFAAFAGVGTFIYQMEGEVNRVYADPAGINTACMGHVNNNLQQGQTFTDEECVQIFGRDLQLHEAELDDSVTVDLTEPERFAYTSFHLNVGGPNFNQSTLRKLLNAGNRIDACIELTHACSSTTKECGGWTYSKGVQYPGLVDRRSKERNICLLGALYAENVIEYYLSVGGNPADISHFGDAAVKQQPKN